MSRIVFAALTLASLSTAIIQPAPVTKFDKPADLPEPAAAGVRKSPGALTIAVHRTNYTVDGRKHPHKRQSFDPLRNDISGYSIAVSVGTPPQLVQLCIDTGSSELWVNPQCSTSYYPAGCIANGMYDPSVSPTSQDLLKPFSIRYGLGGVDGEYYSDNVAIGGAKITQQQFGNAVTSDQMMQGIFGLSFGVGLYDYQTPIDKLVTQGIIFSRAFSLNLASIDVNQGSVIFGGIDTMKYSGALMKLPIIPYSLSPDGYPRYWVYMTSVSITLPDSTTPTLLTAPTFNQPMFPDSGSTFCQLPQALFNSLLSYFPGSADQGGAWTVPCSLRSLNGTINFGFGSKTIVVSYREWIWFDGLSCWFAAQPSTQFFLLGDSFMRSAYIVYDQDNMNVHIAQAANCGRNVVAITTGVNAVPSITGECPPFGSTTSSASKATSTLLSSKITTSASPTSSKVSSTSTSVLKMSTATSTKASSISTSTSTSTKASSASASTSTKASSVSMSSKLSTSAKFSSSVKPTSPVSSAKVTSSSLQSFTLATTTKASSASSSIKPSSKLVLSSSVSTCKASTVTSVSLVTTTFTTTATSVQQVTVFVTITASV